MERDQGIHERPRGPAGRDHEGLQVFDEMGLCNGADGAHGRPGCSAEGADTMTTTARLLAATAEYIEASHALLASSTSMAVAVRFFLAKRDVRALARHVLPRNAELILARLIAEAATDEATCAKAERMFVERWKRSF